MIFKNLLLSLVLMGIGIYSLTLLFARQKTKYTAIPIMTPNEIEFFHRIQYSLGNGFFVFPQVAMSALIRPIQSYQNNKRAFWQVNQKRVDYAIFNKNMKLICIVELDDKTHNQKLDEKRDDWFLGAGIQTLRFESKFKPSQIELREKILKMLT